MKNKAFLRRTSIVTMVLLASVLSLPLIQQAHATGIVFKSVCDAGAGIGVTTLSCTLTGVASSDTIIVNIFGVGVFNSFTTTDGQSNTYTNKIFSLTGNGAGISTYIYATPTTASSGSDVITVTTGGVSRIYTFAASDYSGVTGFGQTGSDQQDSAGNTGTSTVTLSGTGSTSAFIDDFGIDNSGGFIATPNNGQTVRDSPTNGGNTPCNGVCKAADTTSPILGWSWSGGSACGCFASHVVLELTAPLTGPSNTVFQCYGNCGNPPITVVNTNSTHTVNFNQSISLFYQFQAASNGFLVNETTNVAKSYANGPNGPIFTVYLVQSCPLGQQPFTAQCPGVSQASAGFLGVAKGRSSLANLKIAVSAGQWIGIALSAPFSGFDVNDTNTSVQMMQTNQNGVITSATVFQPSSKVGLWAWIATNVVVTTGPPTVATCSGGFGGFLDCILPSWVASLCGNPTASCLNTSGLIWSFGLAIFFTFFTMKGAGEITPGTKFPFGEIFMAWALVWIFVLTGIGQIFAWVPIFFFFIVALMFGKHTGRYL